MKIINGITKPKGLRIVIYGVHGVGKTTLASKLDNAVYLDYEGGTHGISCAKVAEEELPRTYAGVIGAFKEFRKDHQGFRNLVIDSADALEDAFDKSYSAEKNIKSIFAVDDYFRTQKAHERSFGDVLDEASCLVESGMNVTFIAHEQSRKVEPLDHNGGKTYDHSDLKLSRKCSQLLLQWADVVIFCAFKTFLVEGEKKGDKAHAGGGKRWCFCSYSPDWEAKCRTGVDLPEDCSLDKMATVLPKAVREAVAQPENGASVSAVNEKDGTAGSGPVARPCTKRLLGLLAQYEISHDEIADYAAPKLKDRYGIENESSIDGWPEEFILWLCRGMDKIAAKIKK